MLQRLIDDLKDGAGSALRISVLVSVVGASLLITTGFLTAAAFIAVLQSYGVIQACLTAAAIFFIVAMIGVISYSAHKRESARRAAALKAAAEQAKSTASTFLTDPAMLAIGLQILRTVGLRKMIPLLAIGGVALGLFAGRHESSDEPPGDS
jgi:hypothetical protein